MEFADTISALRQDGVAFAPWRMADQEVSETLDHLDGCEVWPAHVMCKANMEDHVKLKDARAAGQWPVFSPRMDNIVCAPHFLEYALKSYDIAAAYFGETPRLYSMNCFWTQPAPYSYADTHGWHRDGDDRKQLAMFLFGTDIVDGDGAHLYQRGSHVVADNALGYHFAAPSSDCVMKIYGSRGTLFFSDPSGLHMGLRPSRARMLAWARWGVSDPPASYLWDQLRPTPRALIGDRYPSDPLLQEAIRLVVS